MAIARDASSPSPVTSAGATTTTASFTPPSSSVLVAFCSGDANNSSLDEALTVSDSASGTWHTAISHNANGGAVSAIFWRLVPTSPGSMTVSLTDNKGSVAKRLLVEVFTGTDQTSPIGATASGTTAALSYTSTRDLSWGWSTCLTANAVLTAAGSGNTLVDSASNFDSGDGVGTLQKTATTTPSGSTVTLTFGGTTTFIHHVAVEILPPSSGSTFTASLSGGMTPAGALVKAASKPLAGGMIPTGTLARLCKKALAGGMASAGTLTRLCKKALAGGATPAGTLTRAVSKALAGTLSSAGTLAKQARKTLAGGMTPAGALSTLKVVLKTFTGGMTPSGSMARSTAKGLAGGIAPAGTLSKRTAKAFGGALASAGSLAKSVRKAFAGALTAAGALARAVLKPNARAASTAAVTAQRTSTAASSTQRTSTTAVTAQRTSTTDVEGD